MLFIVGGRIWAACWCLEDSKCYVWLVGSSEMKVEDLLVSCRMGGVFNVVISSSVSLVWTRYVAFRPVWVMNYSPFAVAEWKLHTKRGSLCKTLVTCSFTLLLKRGCATMPSCVEFLRVSRRWVLRTIVDALLWFLSAVWTPRFDFCTPDVLECGSCHICTVISSMFTAWRSFLSVTKKK